MPYSNKSGSTAQTPLPITAIVLAGGHGSRLNYQNKGLIELEGQTLISRVLERLQPQVEHILISANADTSQYEALGHPIIRDEQQQRLGPLSGIASALSHCTTDYALIVPCDSPFLPLDLAQQLYQAALNSKKQVILARDEHRIQPLFVLLHRSCLDALQHALARQELKVGRWMQEQAHGIVKINQAHAFFNINTTKDLETALNIIKNQ